MDLADIQSLAEVLGGAAVMGVLAFGAAVAQLGSMKRKIEGAAGRADRGAKNVLTRLMGREYESLAESDPGDAAVEREDEQSGALKTVLRVVVEEGTEPLRAEISECRREIADLREEVGSLRRGHAGLEARVNEHSDKHAIAEELAAEKSIVDGAIPRKTP